MKRGKKSYPREFKVEAMRQLAKGGVSQAELARRLGVHPRDVYRWTQLFEKHQETAFPGAGHPVGGDVERMRRELEQVKAERDILKKAAAFFARELS